MAGKKVVIILDVDNKGSATVKKFDADTERAFNNLKQNTRASTASMGASLQKLKTHWLGITAAMTGTVYALGKVMQKFATWEVSLTDMKKVTTESLDSIKAKIMSLGPALGTSTELVKGYYQVISAGVKHPIKSLSLLITASKTAKAAHVDQSEVIKGLTKIMAGYESQIKDVSEAADLLFAIEKEGQTNVAELIPVIGGLAKISHDLSISHDEMGASLAQITQTAGSTAEAAIQYQGVLLALMKPTTDMQKAIHDMGYESAQAAIQELGLANTLQKLKESTHGSAEKMAALFGNVRGLKGISALASNEFENLNAKVDEMRKKTGSAADAWSDYKKTSTSAWDSLKASIEKVTTAIGEGLAPAAKKLANWLSEAAEYWTKLFREGPGEKDYAKEMLEDYRDELREYKEDLLHYTKILENPGLSKWIPGYLEKVRKWREETIKNIALVEAKIAFLTQPKAQESVLPPVPKIPSPKDGESSQTMEEYIEKAKKAAAILNAPPFDWEQWIPPVNIKDEMAEYVKRAKEMAAIEYAEPFDYEQWITGYDEVEKKGVTTFDHLKNAVTGWASTFSSQLNDMLWAADTTFADILESFGRMITQMVIQKQVVEPMLTSWFGGAAVTSAHGNVFQNGSITPYGRGGIVNRPTLFPMANGAGLMGEKGPEGVLPLTRTRSGDLGVKTQGAGPNIEINMINQSGHALEATQSRLQSGQESGKYIIDVVVKELQRGRTLRQTIRSTI